MKRRQFLTYTFAGLLVAGQAFGQSAAVSLEDQLVTQLVKQGFTSIKRSRTLLGRVRFMANRPGVKREIIFNPRTGEILRDYWMSAAGSTPTLFDPGDDGGNGNQGNSGSSGSGSGGGSGDDSGGGGSGDDSGGGGSGDDSGGGSGGGGGGGDDGGGDDHGGDDGGGDGRDGNDRGDRGDKFDR